MFSPIMPGGARKALLVIVAGAIVWVCGNPIAAAPSPAPTNPGVKNPSTPTAAPGFVVLTQPVKIKIAYGETVLPAGMKLPVVSSDAATVRINYLGETQTIPNSATRFEATVSELPITSPQAAPPPSIASPTPQSQVSLQPGYDSRMQGSDTTMRELQLLLSPHCKEGVDLGGAGTKIYNGVTYLMDSEPAATILGLPHSVPSRVPVATPGFPKNSLYYIGYDGAFEGHFNRLYLVTDVANKVVAIQLVDEHPKSRWKSAAALAAATWSTYNFVNARMRASDSVRVQAASKREGSAILIETQMYQLAHQKAGGSANRYEQKENTKLFVPIPFARIILHCIQIGLSKA